MAHKLAKIIKKLQLEEQSLIGKCTKVVRQILIKTSLVSFRLILSESKKMLKAPSPPQSGIQQTLAP